jgi:membrane-associated phospholipid phosphatase
VTSRQCLGAAAIACVLSIVAAPAHAQPSSGADSGSIRLEPDRDSEVPTVVELFTLTLGDFRHLPSAGNLAWLAVGGAAALATHTADQETSRILSESRTLQAPLEGGAIVGGTPFELGAAFAAYGLGRAYGNRRIANAGADLVQAQVVAEVLTIVIKQATRRARPEGSGYSFPSGHTTTTFASATVLQQHFGWRIGLPAYAVAAYVGASRIHDRRHYLSDVAFGAALGTVAGRTVMVSRRHRMTLGVAAAPGGGAIVMGM